MAKTIEELLKDNQQRAKAGAATMGQLMNQPKLEQGKPSLGQKLLGFLPEPIRKPVAEVAKNLRDGLFGDPMERIQAIELEKQYGPRDIVTQMGTEGLFPFLGRSKTEQIIRLNDKLVEKGTDPSRAADIAFYEVNRRSPEGSNMMEVQANKQAFQKKLDELKPTKDEKFALTMSGLGQKAGSALDVLNVIPIGSIESKGTQGLIKILPKLAKADDAAKIVTMLTKTGIEEKAAQELAETIAKTTSEAQVAKTLGLADNVAGKAKGATSKALEATGDVFYHGTNNADQIIKEGFNIGKAGESSGYKGIMGTGVYLDTTPTAEGAKLYGKEILKVKPKEGLKFFEWNGKIDQLYTEATKYGDPVEIAKYMKEEGYDGIKGLNQMVVFDPKNVEVIGKAGKGTGELVKTADKAVETAKDVYRYHETSPKSIESIQKSGLKMTEGQYGRGVYFAPEAGKNEASGVGAIIRANKDDLKVLGYDEFPDQGWTTSSVPPQVLEYSLDGGKTWKPLTEAVGTKAKQAKTFLLPETPEQKSVFDRAAKWITDWATGKRVGAPDAEVQLWLDQFTSKEPQTLYRGAASSKEPTRLTSWSTNMRTAKEFGIESGKKAGQSLEQVVNPERIVADLGNISYHSDVADEILGTIKNKKLRDEVATFLSGEGEVVVRPLQASAEKKAAGREMQSIGDILAEGGNKVPPKKPATMAELLPGKGPERKLITRVKEAAPVMTDLLEGKYTRRSTQELLDKAIQIIKDTPDEAIRMATTGTDDQSVAVAMRLIENNINEAKTATDALAKNAAYDKAAEIANAAAKNLTEAGRSVQAASLWGRMTPEGYVRYASKEIQKYNELIKSPGKMGNFFGTRKPIPDLTGEQTRFITEGMEKIQKMADGVEKQKALFELSKQVRKWIPSTLWEKVVSVWKAGLLTGLKTSGLNMASNLSSALAEIAKDVPASMVDNIVSWFTGERTLALTGRDSLSGAAEGAQKGWSFLKTGFDERNVLDKLDFRKVNFGDGKVGKALQAYTDTVFGVLGAEDQAFYYSARARSLASQAIAQAKNEGLSGRKAIEFAQKLIENPTDDMLKYATLDAETAVFQQDSWLARSGKKAQKLFGEVILPFAKTPANVADAMVNYSPAGIVKTIIKNVGKGKFDQRLFSQGMGRGITGTAVIAIGAALYNAGLMALNYPTSEKEQKQWELEGRTRNSIKIGGKWRNVGVLGPLGMVAIVGGHLAQGIKDTGSFVGGLINAAGGAGSALTEQSFLTGVNKTVEALKDPQRSFTGFASSLAGSIVPTIIADFARATDQFERRDANPLQRIKSRIPGLRESLEPQVTVFGKDKPAPGFATTMFDPTRPGTPAEDENSPVVIELRRLMDAGQPVTPTQLGGTKGYAALTPAENTYLWKLSGQWTREAVEKAMAEKGYKKGDDEIKAKIIDRYVADATLWARARAVFEITKGLPKEEKDRRLQEMRDEKNGILTQRVEAALSSIKK